jgi:hypothetical protein
MQLEQLFLSDVFIYKVSPDLYRIFICMSFVVDVVEYKNYASHD